MQLLGIYSLHVNNYIKVVMMYIYIYTIILSVLYDLGFKLCSYNLLMLFHCFSLIYKSSMEEIKKLQMA